MYDVIVVGAGPVGLASGMYAGRLNLKTMVIGDYIGGTLETTTNIENYPGFKSISGEEITRRLKEHAEEYGVDILEERVGDIERVVGGFEVETGEEESFTGRAIIFATGTRHRKLQARGAEEFENRGVHYCALCDGPLYRDKVVGVVGGSDSAAKEALVLQDFASKVYIIYRGEKIHPEPPNLKRVEESEKIKVINNANVLEVGGNRRLKQAVLDRDYRGSSRLSLSAVFVAIGGEPQSGLAKKLGVGTNAKGEIVIDRESSTSLPGVFAAGDVCDTSFKQAIVGVGEGVAAAYSAYRYFTKGHISTRGRE